MFQGSSALTLDAKGRLTIPARHRDALINQSDGRVTLTRHPDGCLLLYPRSAWELKRSQIVAFPAQARPLQRLLLGNAQDVDLDGAGRVLVAPELRQAAQLAREVMLLGMGTHFELWDTAMLGQHEQRALEQGIPDVVQDFSF